MRRRCRWEQSYGKKGKRNGAGAGHEREDEETQARIRILQQERESQLSVQQL